MLTKNITRSFFFFLTLWSKRGTFFSLSILHSYCVFYLRRIWWKLILTVLPFGLSLVAVTQECALAIQRLAASFVAGASRPLKSFQRMLDLMVSASPVLQLNLLRMRPLQRWLKPRVPSSRMPANQGEQVISLSALPPSDKDQELKLLYPIRAVKIYLECSALFRQLDQHFVCFGNRTKGRPVTKQKLPRWIVNTITLAYSSFGLHCPIGVWAHSTRGVVGMV